MTHDESVLVLRSAMMADGYNVDSMEDLVKHTNMGPACESCFHKVLCALRVAFPGVDWDAVRKDVK